MHKTGCVIIEKYSTGCSFYSVSSHVCRLTCVCLHVHIGSCGSQRIVMDVICHPFVTDSLLHLELAIRWGWLTVSARTGCLLIPDAGIASTYDHAQLFFVGAGNRTQVHMPVWLSSWPQRMLLLLFSPLFLWTWVWHTLNAGKPQTRSFSWTAKFSETKREKKLIILC